MDNPIRFIDPDGIKVDAIIILSALSHTYGLGHAAVLIGDDQHGWFLYSKNGTHGSWGSRELSSGPSNRNPEKAVRFKTLTEFANSTHNFEEDKSGDVVYTAAYRIETDAATDEKMKVAAAAQVDKDYNVTNASCITVATDALAAGKLNVPMMTTGPTGTAPQAVPNYAYDQIKRINKGTDATQSITPTEQTKAEMKQNSKEVKAEMQKKSAEQARAIEDAQKERIGQSVFQF